MSSFDTNDMVWLNAVAVVIIICLNISFIHSDKWQLAIHCTYNLVFATILQSLSSPLSLPVMLTVRAVVSAAVFVWELSSPLVGLSTLEFMIFFAAAPCHAVIAHGETVIHARGGDTPEVHDQGMQLAAKAYYRTCVGVSLENNVKAFLEKLKGCGKCSDWAMVVSAILSQNLFLTYCAVSHVRWPLWLVCGAGMAFQAWGLARGVSVEDSELVLDLCFTIMLAFDSYNLLAFPPPHLRYRSPVILKEIFFAVLCLILHCYLPKFVRLFGVYIFFLTSVCCSCLITHMIGNTRKVIADRSQVFEFCFVLLCTCSIPNSY